jgi:hypothetical protein
MEENKAERNERMMNQIFKNLNIISKKRRGEQRGREEKKQVIRNCAIKYSLTNVGSNN